MKRSRVRWLQRELQLRLILPLLVIVAATGLLGAWGAQELVDRVFDRWLVDAANSLANQVQFQDGSATIELSPQAEAMLAYDAIDRTYHAVVQDRRHLLGHPGLPTHALREKAYGSAHAFDAQYNGQPVRIVRVSPVHASGTRADVVVAETLTKRQRARADLLLMLAPLLLLLMVTAVAIGLIVRRTVRPLERIAARWEERSNASLDAIATEGVPRELMPFASALNALLARVREMLDRERQFAATAAHQLRTPLAGLQLGLARAAEAPDIESAQGVLRELGKTTQRTARLVQQLLLLSRLDPELRALQPLAPVDLVSLARDVGESYLDAALDKQIDIELACAEPQVLAAAQPELLSEALGNLVHNAIRYTPAGGRIVVAVETAPVALSVCDSGPGIQPDEREKVFERFVRGRACPGDGSGLGLAIVREIAELHGARATLGPSALGGTCARLAFPNAVHEARS